MEETAPQVLADVPGQLAELDGLPLSEQLERYDALHRDIAAGLAQVDEAVSIDRPTGPGSSTTETAFEEAATEGHRAP